MPSIEDVIYTAGLFDGEGSISLALYKGGYTKQGLPRNSPALLLQLSSTHEPIILWLREIWQVGITIVSYRPKRPNHQTAYSWRVYGPQAALVLQALLPYLKIKHPQAQLGLEYRALIGQSGHKIGREKMLERLEYRSRMNALNGHKHSKTFTEPLSI